MYVSGQFFLVFSIYTLVKFYIINYNYATLIIIFFKKIGINHKFITKKMRDKIKNKTQQQQNLDHLSEKRAKCKKQQREHRKKKVEV